MDDDRTQVWLLRTQPIQRVPALRGGPRDDPSARRQAAAFAGVVLAVILLLFAIPWPRPAAESETLRTLAPAEALLTESVSAPALQSADSQLLPVLRQLAEPSQMLSHWPVPAPPARHWDHIAPPAPVWQETPPADWSRLPTPIIGADSVAAAVTRSSLVQR